MPDETSHEHQPMTQTAPVEYTCPMHPEVVQNEPGSCPKCGMFLVPREVSADSRPDEHVGMDHSAMNHDDMAFMSMIDVTKDLPRSSDGLPMDWIDVPFGPFFPGLPGGLLLTLTLDGDTVAGASAQTLAENTALLQDSAAMDAERFVERLAKLDPLAPLAYQFLAHRAIENVAGVEISATAARGRIGALERERIASHLGWLALFAQQTGFDWLLQRATSLQLQSQQANRQQIRALKPEIDRLKQRLRRTPLLKSRTAGVGQLLPGDKLRGPVARAAGITDDARSTDPAYTALGFKASHRNTSDILARLQVRLDEISHSLVLIEAAGSIDAFTLPMVAGASGDGEAVIETARGSARLQLRLEKGQVISAQLDTPSTQHLTLIGALTEQQALGDALLTVGSLDLSPWEIRQ
jgi:Ni,Fe-hydrogenase III large subunit